MTRGVTLGSSLRSRTAAATLGYAKAKARTLGITRVTDITRLDRVGVPVFASIRPAALEGSLCVNAGKGTVPIEAEVGAYMEAIEFAMAEPGAAPHVEIVQATARAVLDGRRRRDAILDLCPLLGQAVRLDAPLPCVEAESLDGRSRVLVPAELVFLPFRPHPRFRPIFGTSSNGLASGNTAREATVHALAELVERDISSFEAVRDTSALVDLQSIDGPSAAIVTAIREAGLELFVRTVSTRFDIPYFTATVHDPHDVSPHLVNAGYGCHPHRSIALVRAICEALQSRLSFIHGGRDDLLGRHERFRGWSVERRHAHVKHAVATASDARRVVTLDGVGDHSEAVTSVAECERLLIDRLRAAGLRDAYRVRLSDPDDALQIVRVVVPGLELFTDTLRRVGNRLRDHARAA